MVVDRIYQGSVDIENDGSSHLRPSLSSQITLLHAVQIAIFCRWTLSHLLLPLDYLITQRFNPFFTKKLPRIRKHLTFLFLYVMFDVFLKNLNLRVKAFIVG